MIKKPLNLFLALAGMEFFIAAISMLAMERDSRNAILFGYSAQRLGLVFFSIICGILCLLLTQKADIQGIRQKLHELSSKNPDLLNFLSIALFLSGMIILLAPPGHAGRYFAYLERVRPLMLVFTTLPFQFLFPGFFHSRSLSGKRNVLPYAVFTVILCILFGFIALSKLGIKADTHFWNVAGIPLTTLQLLMISLIVTASFYTVKKISAFPGTTSFGIDLTLSLLIYVAGAWVWSHTPMLKHFFALRPLPPLFQLFPYSDARDHDLGAIFTLSGYGINSGEYTDKPLYMVFLAILHLITGDDYNSLSLFHLYVMALVLPALFWLGKSFYGRYFGMALALITLFRQKNALLLANLLASTNPRLLTTEMPAMLGLVLFFYIVFLWFTKKDSNKAVLPLAFLAGAILAAISLIRLNPLGLIPLIVISAVIVFQKMDRKKVMQQVFIFILGFFMVFTPWILSGRDANGDSYFWLKILDVITVRYPDISLQENKESHSQRRAAHSPMNANYRNEKQSGQTDNFSTIIINHSLHNIVTAFLALPDSLSRSDQDTKYLIQRPYWDEKQLSSWNGRLEIAQIPMVVFNLFLIAIGLGWGWSKWKWTGVLPAMFFLIYILTLGFARTSGSRYITPVDWIVFFYYALGIIVMIETFSNVVVHKDPDDHVLPDRKFSFNPNILIYSVVFLLGILIPIAQIPVLTHNFPACENNGIHHTPSDSDLTVIKGRALYPYFEKNSFSFTFLFCGKSTPISISGFNTSIKQNQTILIGFSDANINQPEIIFVEEDSKLITVWENHK